MVKGKKKIDELGLTSTNELAPVKPLTELIQKIEITDNNEEKRPAYTQKIKNENEKRELGAGNSSAAPSNGAKKDKNSGPKKFFNNNRRPGNSQKPPFRPQLKKQEVVAMPEEVPYTEYIINENNVEFFSGPAHYISALYPVVMNVDGNEYNSVEHYYQACKIFTLVGKDAAAVTKSASSPIEVKQIAKKLLTGKASTTVVDKWKKTESLSILKHAISQKFSQNLVLKQKLLDTGDKILVQAYNGDNFFAAGANAKFATEWIKTHNGDTIKIPTDLSSDTIGYSPIMINGKNILGFLTMEVRQELRQLENK